MYHAYVKRLTLCRQAQAFSSRLYALAGTNTMDNIPPSDNTTLDFRIDIGYADLLYPKPESRVTMESVMSTIRGPFCYIYV
jgi:tyrosinase